MHAAFKAFGKQLVNTVTGKTDVSINQTDDVLLQCKDQLTQIREEIGTVKKSFSQWSEHMSNSCETGVELAHAVKSVYEGSNHQGRTKLIDYFDKAQQNIATDTFKHITNHVMTHDSVCGKLSDWLQNIQNIETEISNCERNNIEVQNVSDKLYAMKEQYSKKKNSSSGISPGSSSNGDGSSDTVGAGNVGNMGNMGILGNINLNLGASSNYGSTEQDLEELNRKIEETQKGYDGLRDDYTTQRKEIQKQVQQMMNDKHVLFDGILVDILECQYNFYANCTKHVVKFERGIKFYREKFPKSNRDNNNNNSNSNNKISNHRNMNGNVENIRNNDRNENNNNMINGSNSSSNSKNKNKKRKNRTKSRKGSAEYDPRPRNTSNTRSNKKNSENGEINESSMNESNAGGAKETLANGSKNLLAKVANKQKQLRESRESRKGSKSRKQVLSKSARTSPQPRRPSTSKDQDQDQDDSDLIEQMGNQKVAQSSENVFGEFMAFTPPQNPVASGNGNMNGSNNNNQVNNSYKNNRQGDMNGHSGNNNNNMPGYERQDSNDLLGDFMNSSNYNADNHGYQAMGNMGNMGGNDSNMGGNNDNDLLGFFDTPQQSPGQNLNSNGNGNNHLNASFHSNGNNSIISMDGDDWGDFTSTTHNLPNSAPNSNPNLNQGSMPSLIPEFGNQEDHSPRHGQHQQSQQQQEVPHATMERKLHRPHSQSSYIQRTQVKDPKQKTRNSSQGNVKLSDRAAARAKAVAKARYEEIQQQYAKADQELQDRNDAIEAHGARIDDWEYDMAKHQRRNLRTLISTLPNVLWEGSGWKPVSLSQLLSKDQLNRQYKKACRLVHPDKSTQRGDSTERKTICERIFEGLNAAWATEFGKGVN